MALSRRTWIPARKARRVAVIMRPFRDDVIFAPLSRRPRVEMPPGRRELALALLAACVLPATSHALGFGRIVGEPILGETLQLTIPLIGSIDRPLDNDCVTLRRPPDSIDAEYFPRDLAARVDAQAGVRLLVLSTRSALRQPLVEFRIGISCGYNLHHDYLLMVSPRGEPVQATPSGAAVRPPARPVPAPEPTARPPAPATAGRPLPDGLAGKTLTPEADITLEELARRQFPGPLRRERFMRWVAEANPELFAGVTDIRRHRLRAGQALLVPDGVPPRRPGDHRPPASADGGPSAASPAPAALPAPDAPATAGKAAPKPATESRKDRLVIGGDASGARDFKETLALVDRLTGMLEQQVAAQAANDERIRGLETALADMARTVAQVEANGRQREAQWLKDREEQRQLLQERPTQGWLQLLLAIVAGGAAGAGLLAAYRMLRSRARPATTQFPPAVDGAEVPATSRADDQALPPAWDELLSSDAEPAPGALPATDLSTGATPTAASEDLDWQAAARPAAGADLDFPIEFEPPAAVKPAGPAAAAGLRTGGISVEPAASDPAAAAIELANIMVSMGLAESAAQTLVDHITENPRQSLHHWLKLLELHRINGNRQGFEASARELHQHFNVEPLDWSQEIVPGARDSIEAFPHLRTHLIKLWRQPECVKFLQALLLDNRDGTRTGFPLPVAEEILLLIAVQSSEP